MLNLSFPVLLDEVASHSRDDPQQYTRLFLLTPLWLKLFQLLIQLFCEFRSLCEKRVHLLCFLSWFVLWWRSILLILKYSFFSPFCNHCVPDWLLSCHEWVGLPSYILISFYRSPLRCCLPRAIAYICDVHVSAVAEFAWGVPAEPTLSRLTPRCQWRSRSAVIISHVYINYNRMALRGTPWRD